MDSVMEKQSQADLITSLAKSSPPTLSLIQQKGQQKIQYNNTLLILKKKIQLPAFDK